MKELLTIKERDTVFTSREDAALQGQARHDNVHVYVVGIVIHRDSEILLLQRRSDDYMPDVWEIPGGHLDEGESITEAVRRELFEETHFHLTDIVSYHGYYDYAGEFGVTRQWNFVVSVASTQPLIHPEHQAAIWADSHLSAVLPMTEEMSWFLRGYWTQLASRQTTPIPDYRD